jgi:hypothetical protein
MVRPPLAPRSLSLARMIRGVLFCGLLAAGVLRAQDVKATARVDSSNILIGDWLNLHLEIRHKDNVTVQFPAVADSLEGMEVIKRGAPSREESNQQILESATYTLTAFDTGTFIIPPLSVQYTTAGDTTRRSVQTFPIAIFVHGLGVDTTKDIKDIKPPLTVSISFAEMLPYILGVLGLGAAIWLIYYIVKKRRRGEALLPEAPPRPAHELALEALRSLEGEKLWQRGMLKEYHSQLTDIVRTYLERRFGLLAMEMITDEILSSAVIASLEAPVRAKLQEMLVLADLVKFAKFQPGPEEHERSLRSAFTVVEATWQAAAPEAPPAAAAPVPEEAA